MRGEGHRVNGCGAGSFVGQPQVSLGRCDDRRLAIEGVRAGRCQPDTQRSRVSVDACRHRVQRGFEVGRVLNGRRVDLYAALQEFGLDERVFAEFLGERQDAVGEFECVFAE